MKLFLRRNKKSQILSLLVVLTFLCVPQFPVTGQGSTISVSESDIDPKGIRVTSKNDPTDSATISWYTEQKVSNPEVEYSKAHDLSDSKVKIAQEKQVDGTCIYSASIEGLDINTTYYYQVMDDTNIYNFTTAEQRNVTHTEFLVIGDTQNVDDVSGNITAKVMQKFGDGVDFFIHMGDIVDEGEKQGWYNKYFRKMEPFHTNVQGYFTEGNHERGLATKMYDNVPLPSNGRDSRYYSFNWGPASFLSLNDNNAEFLPHQKMPLLWLENELSNFEKDKYTVWKFAYMHQPIFNAKPSRSDKPELAATWCSMFDDHGMDIVFLGHNHYYQRSYPMNHQGEINDSAETQFNDPQYPMYITSNTDSKQYSVSDGDTNYELPEFVNYHNKSTEVMHVEILIDETQEKTTLSAETWAMRQEENEQGEITFLMDQNLSLIDAFNITKSLPEKYLDSEYQTPSLTSYTRMPYFVYIILYFAVFGLVMLILERKALQRYYSYKKAALSGVSERSDQGNTKRTDDNDFKKSILSVLISIGLAIAFAAGMIIVDIFDEILALVLGILGALLIKAPINYFLYNKNKHKALNALPHMLFFFCFAGIAAVIILAFNVLYYLFYLNFILLAISALLIYAANGLSKKIGISRISGKKSFYLGGSFLFFASIMVLVGSANLIACI
ncbi:MAG: metallophosphoesterase [Promethearchaeia archaeon]